MSSDSIVSVVEVRCGSLVVSAGFVLGGGNGRGSARRRVDGGGALDGRSSGASAARLWRPGPAHAHRKRRIRAWRGWWAVRLRQALLRGRLGDGPAEVSPRPPLVAMVVAWPSCCTGDPVVPDTNVGTGGFLSLR